MGAGGNLRAHRFLALSAHRSSRCDDEDRTMMLLVCTYCSPTAWRGWHLYFLAPVLVLLQFQGSARVMQ